MGNAKEGVAVVGVAADRALPAWPCGRPRHLEVRAVGAPRVAARRERGGYSAAPAAHHWRRRAGPGRRRPWRWRRHDRSRCASRLGRTTSCGVQTRTAWARPGVVRRFRRSVARTPDCAASAPRSRERIALRCRHRGCGADTSVRSRRGSQWSASARSCATSTTVNASRSTTNRTRVAKNAARADRASRCTSSCLRRRFMGDV
jgi:hypothetical protein